MGTVAIHQGITMLQPHIAVEPLRSAALLVEPEGIGIKDLHTTTSWLSSRLGNDHMLPHQHGRKDH
jgi:hypothetical protein